MDERTNPPQAGLGGTPPVMPGRQLAADDLSKLPPPADLPPFPGSLGGDDPLSQEMREAWAKYTTRGFENIDTMFQKTLSAFMWPYRITVLLYVVLFLVGISLFVVATVLALRGDQPLVAAAFGGLSVASFLLFFIRQPLQALEENLEFITWLGVAFNTYWTRLMYIQDSARVQEELKAAAEDYYVTVERLIHKHAALRERRPGAEPEAAAEAAGPGGSLASAAGDGAVKAGGSSTAGATAAAAVPAAPAATATPSPAAGQADVAPWAGLDASG